MRPCKYELFNKLEAEREKYEKYTDLFSEAQGMKGTLYSRTMEGFELNWLKGEFVFKNQTLENFCELFKFKNDEYNINKDCLEWKVLERNGEWPTVCYVAYRFPISFIYDRDLVLNFNQSWPRENQCLISMNSTKHPLKP